MAKDHLLNILDVGSNKVVCYIAELTSQGQITIQGIGHQLSEGISGGTITEVQKAEMSMLAAIHAAENMAGVTIEHVVVSVSGATLASHQVTVESAIAGQEVTERDIQRVIDLGQQQCKSEGQQILHCIPSLYRIDEATHIKDPVGMVGDKLSTDLHIVTVSSSITRNFTHCLARCHVEVDHYIASALASGLACLEEDERELGVTLVDMGASQTQIAVFERGQLLYVSSLPVGGAHVTKDVAKGLSTSIAFAERLKVLYGAVNKSENDAFAMIDVSVADLQADQEAESLQRSYLSKHLLASIIRPRIEETFEMVMRNLAEAGFEEIPGQRVVITGGASQIHGLKELAGQMMQKHIRIGKPRYVEGMAESHQSPMFSSAVGMLLCVQQGLTQARRASGASHRALEIASSGARGGKLMQWFRENF